MVPFALAGVLDGKDPGDYLQRVEPSVEGGRKMGRALLEVCLREEGAQGGVPPPPPPPTASTGLIAGGSQAGQKDA